MSRLNNYPDTYPDEIRSFSSPVSTMQDLATWVQRVFALVIDVVVIGVLAVVVLMVTALVTFTPTATTTMFSMGSSNNGIFTGHGIYWYELVGIGIASILYFAILDGRTQTLGKMTLGIAVRDRTTGQPIGVPRALVRWIIFMLLWEVFFVPGFLNALSPSWDRRRQAWHDHAVGSVVLELD